MTFRLRLRGAAMGATACTMLLAGCSGGTSYYMVREPGSSAMPYYTTAVERAGNGAIQFKDARTGSAVALQSSEVKAISSDEYTKGLATAVAASVPPAATAAPAPAAAGASAPAPQGKPQ